MMKKNFFLFFFFLICGASIAHAEKKYLNPREFGLTEARDGVERYEALRRCHLKAKEDGCYVSYDGIDSIFVEIPKNAVGIPLADKTDFCGATITVKNRYHDVFLFTMERELQPIYLTARQIVPCTNDRYKF